MCNLYDVGPGPEKAEGWIAEAIAALGRLAKTRALRRTDPGLVVTADLTPRVMRWGFERPFNPAINNARSDKLLSGMWSEAFRERRCLIPISSFYEWSGPKGHKRTHRIGPPRPGWLWAAGIWEDHPELGPCYSMVTTAANATVAPIHDRMPAILAAPPDYFASEQPPGPSPVPLAVTDCANPLTPGRPEQGELFPADPLRLDSPSDP